MTPLGLQVIHLLLDSLECPDHCLPLHGEESVQPLEIFGNPILALFVYSQITFHLCHSCIQGVDFLARLIVGHICCACRLDRAHPHEQLSNDFLVLLVFLVVLQVDRHLILLCQVHLVDFVQCLI